MTKADLVNKIYEQTGVDKKEINTVIERFYKVVQDNMAKKENIYLRGFGSFLVIKKNQKPGRDIGRKKNIIIPSHYKPRFKPVKSFKDLVKDNVK